MTTKHTKELCKLTERFLDEACALLHRWYKYEAPPWSETEMIMVSRQLLEDTEEWLRKVAPKGFDEP